MTQRKCNKIEAKYPQISRGGGPAALSPLIRSLNNQRRYGDGATTRFIAFFVGRAWGQPKSHRVRLAPRAHPTDAGGISIRYSLGAGISSASASTARGSASGRRSTVMPSSTALLTQCSSSRWTARRSRSISSIRSPTLRSCQRIRIVGKLVNLLLDLRDNGLAMKPEQKRQASGVAKGANQSACDNYIGVWPLGPIDRSVAALDQRQDAWLPALSESFDLSARPPFGFGRRPRSGCDPVTVCV